MKIWDIQNTWVYHNGRKILVFDILEALTADQLQIVFTVAFEELLAKGQVHGFPQEEPSNSRT